MKNNKNEYAEFVDSSIKIEVNISFLNEQLREYNNKKKNNNNMHKKRSLAPHVRFDMKIILSQDYIVDLLVLLNSATQQQ